MNNSNKERIDTISRDNLLFIETIIRARKYFLNIDLFGNTLCVYDSSKETITRTLCTFHSPFVSAVISDLLLSGNIFNKKHVIIRKNIDLLKAQCRPNGLFCFFGKHTDYPSDLDDTACAWIAILNYYPSHMSDVPIDTIFHNRNRAGDILTWYNRPNHDVADWVVLGNVLRLLHRCCVVDYKLNREFEKSILEACKSKTGSPYYSDIVVALAFSAPSIRDLFGRNSKCSDAVVRCMEEISINSFDPRFAAYLYVLSVLGTPKKDDMEKLVYQQKPDGGWESFPLFNHLSKEKCYDSRAVSTAFSVAAINSHFNV
ncbi:MAG: hypothetical protein KZQ96_21270 [Candidatus Thiodiazotropha sp. (ex Lucinoma borealis)]|nr:hypothetical protein [Candidatus Thiodiazotropha sp. (ex Lucinoma borealis)]